MEGLENKYKATEQENLTLKLELTKLSEKVDVMKDEYSNRLQEAEFKWDIIACLVKEYSELRKRTLGISEVKMVTTKNMYITCQNKIYLV